MLTERQRRENDFFDFLEHTLILSNNNLDYVVRKLFSIQYAIELALTTNTDNEELWFYNEVVLLLTTMLDRTAYFRTHTELLFNQDEYWYTE